VLASIATVTIAAVVDTTNGRASAFKRPPSP
jgi:hypothetical protein